MTVLPELERQLVEAAAGPSAPPRPARRRARVGGWLAIAASAAVVIGVVVVFAAVGGQAPRLSAAQAQLERAAKTAAGTPTPTLGPGQGWYTRIVGKIAWGPDYTGSYDSDSWIVATGKGFGQGDSQSSRIGAATVRGDGARARIDHARLRRLERALDPGLSRRRVGRDRHVAG